MTLELVDGRSVPEKLELWPLPPQPLFVGSHQFDRLSRDLRRYVRGDIAGRSYLIAGHRGAGKTALVLRAVEDLRTSILQLSVQVDSPLRNDEEPLQRPLLVKLHGPSLLRRPDPAGIKDQAGDQDEAEQGATGQAPAASGTGQDPATSGTGQDPAAGTSEPGESPKPDGDSGSAQQQQPPGQTEIALVQITIALYRALAAEAVLGFEVHAQTLAKRIPGDFPERAAQLALDLDGGASAATLRRCWDAIGRLAPGILWPRTADATLEARDVRNQGLKEIVAIATAAQAFQVCTGRVSYTAATKDKATRTASAQVTGSSNLKDVIGRVSTLGIGAASGVAVAGATEAGAIAAIGAGLATWLIGNLSLSWSTSRTRNSDLSIDHSFIRDTEVTTLDRDLPLVIKRVREAGLAPIFVIDELDKVEDARLRIDGLIRKLKHLLTDYGFFCFLVNRDLYDEIDRIVEKEAYPVEHTYYSERLLVRSEPHRLLIYLAQTVREKPPESPTAGKARTVFALAAMHRAKFNLADLGRAMAEVAGTGDQLRVDEAGLTSSKQLFAATIQLAINEILADPELAERLEADSSFAQLLIDTLYYPSRLWERGKPEVPAGDEDLKSALLERMVPDEAKRAKLPDDAIPPDDLESLHALLCRLLDDLADFPAFKIRVEGRLAFDDKVVRGPSQAVIDRLPTEVLLGDIFPSQGSLLEKPAPGSSAYKFLYDKDGVKEGSRGGPWSARRRAEATRMIAIASAFETVLAKAGLNLDRLPVGLSPGIAKAELEDAKTKINASIAANRISSDASTGLERLRRLEAELASKGKALGSALLLLGSVARDAGASDGIVDRISRLIDFRSAPETWLTEMVPPDFPLAADAAALADWSAQFEARLMAAPTAEAALEPTARYAKLTKPLKLFLDGATAKMGQFTYGELVLAAKGEAPYRYLRPDAAEMTVGDWSGLALQAMPPADGRAGAPYWVLIAALRVLGFGKPLVDELVDPEALPDLLSDWEVAGPSWTLAQELAAKAPGARRGLLHIGDQHPAARARPLNRPILVIGETASTLYEKPIRWLEKLEAFELATDASPMSDDPGMTE